MAIPQLREQLKKLTEVQQIDSQIYALQQNKASGPQEIKALQETFELKKQTLAELEKKSLDVQKQKKDKDLELAAKEESAKKLQGQLYSLKTNKEYQTMLQQISDAKADASVIEDRILSLMEAVDRTKADVDQEKQRLQQEEKVFIQEKKKVEEKIQKIEQEIAQLEDKRKQLIPAITPAILSQYERILHSRDGLALVSVKNNSCLGCHMYVPPQVINLVSMYEDLITCEACNRILYIEEEEPPQQS